MKKIFFILGIFLSWTIVSNSQVISKFEFSITWGVMSRNSYNSKTKEFQKDLVLDVYRGKLKLTRKQMKSILQKINEINFWGIPERYTGTRPPPVNGEYQLGPSITPNSHYSISVNLNGKSHSVAWSMESIDMGEKGRFNELNSLYKYIGSIISSSKEWKNAPPMQGGYR